MASTCDNCHVATLSAFIGLQRLRLRRVEPCTVVALAYPGKHGAFGNVIAFLQIASPDLQKRIDVAVHLESHLDGGVRFDRRRVVSRSCRPSLVRSRPSALVPLSAAFTSCFSASATAQDREARRPESPVRNSFARISLFPQNSFQFGPRGPVSRQCASMFVIS